MIEGLETCNSILCTTFEMRYGNELFNCSGPMNGRLFMVKTVLHVFWRPSNRQRKIKLVFSASCHLIVDSRLSQHKKLVWTQLFVSSLRRSLRGQVDPLEIDFESNARENCYDRRKIDTTDTVSPVMTSMAMIWSIFMCSAAKNSRARCLTLIHCCGTKFQRISRTLDGPTRNKNRGVLERINSRSIGTTPSPETQPMFTANAFSRFFHCVSYMTRLSSDLEQRRRKKFISSGQHEAELQFHARLKIISSFIGLLKVFFFYMC